LQNILVGYAQVAGILSSTLGLYCTNITIYLPPQLIIENFFIKMVESNS